MIFYPNTNKFGLAKFLAVCGLIVAIFIVSMPYIDVHHLFWEVTVQYRPYFLVFFLFFLLFSLLNRFFSLFFFVFLLSVACVWSVVSPFVAHNLVKSAECQSKATHLRVLTFNIYHLNTAYDDIFANIQNVNADIVFLQEVKSGFYHAAHKKLKAIYPFHSIALENGVAQGGALYSKYPIETHKFVSVTPHNKVLDAMISVSNQSVRLIGLHAASPRSAERIRIRNMLVSSLSGYLGQESQSKPLLIMGDFNSAPWNFTQRRFQRSQDLGTMPLLDFFKLGGSWPADQPALFRVPIDHIYYNHKFNNPIYNNGLSADSDHISIYADLNLCNS